MSIQDQALIDAIKKGDKGAFQELYTLFSDKVYNTALSYVQNSETASDITQEVFIRIFKSVIQFKGNSSLSTWIYRIAVNTSLTHLKKKNRFSFLSIGEKQINKPDFEHPGVLFENKEKAKLLFQAIEHLPNTQKTAFILSFIEELPRKEVAEIMETTLKAIESLLQRAKVNMRKQLVNHYPDRRKNKK